MKATRQAMILEIIENQDIETQEELADQLGRHGVKVTQATVSRDIKELRLLKVLAASGRYQVRHGGTGRAGHREPVHPHLFRIGAVRDPVGQPDRHQDPARQRQRGGGSPSIP